MDHDVHDLAAVQPHQIHGSQTASHAPASWNLLKPTSSPTVGGCEDHAHATCTCRRCFTFSEEARSP